MPSALLDLVDRVAVTLAGGVRVRLFEDGTGVARGRTPGPPPDRLLRIVRDLAPEATPGTVDLRHDGGGRWWIRCKGALADPRLEQRLRNVLGNS